LSKNIPGKWDENIKKRLVFRAPYPVLAVFEPAVGDFRKDFSRKGFFDSLVRPFQIENVFLAEI